jgi:hypothetical protein
MPADYVPLIERAIAKLPEKTPPHRHAVYMKARALLKSQVGDDRAEREALEKAISIVERANNTQPRSSDGGTVFLVLSLLFGGIGWLVDASSMSLFWVARPPKSS